MSPQADHHFCSKWAFHTSRRHCIKTSLFPEAGLIVPSPGVKESHLSSTFLNEQGLPAPSSYPASVAGDFLEMYCISA